MKARPNWTIDALFAGRPESRKLFDLTRAYIESLGPVKVEVSKTQASFGARSKFAWVWLPQMWIKKVKETSIVIAISLSRHVEHRRVKAAVEPTPGRWTHHVVVETEADLDDDVKRWLREAFQAALER